MRKSRTPKLSREQIQAMINAVQGNQRIIKRRGVPLGDAYRKTFKR